MLLSGSPRPGGNCDTAAALFAEGYASAGAERPRTMYLRDFPVMPCRGCDACRSAIVCPLRPPDPCRSGPRAGQAGATETRPAPDTPAAPSIPGTPDISDSPDTGPGPGERFSPEHAGMVSPFAPSAPPFGCPLTLADSSIPLLRALAEDQSLCLVSPIYFYHLPAALKALIDRTQPFWHLRRLRDHPGTRPATHPGPEGPEYPRGNGPDHGVISGPDPRGGSIPVRVCHVILIAARHKGVRLFEGSLLSLKYAFEPLGITLAEPLLLFGMDGPEALASSPRDRERVRRYGAMAGALDAVGAPTVRTPDQAGPDQAGMETGDEG